jgi:hypothetical protein
VTLKVLQPENQHFYHFSLSKKYFDRNLCNNFSIFTPLDVRGSQNFEIHEICRVNFFAVLAAENDFCLPYFNSNLPNKSVFRFNLG